MQSFIAELAQKHKVLPGQVIAALADVGLEHDGSSFEADPEILELVVDTLKGMAGSKTLQLPPRRTPHDVANALGQPVNEVLKLMMTKLAIRGKTLTTQLTEEEVEKIAQHFGYTVEWVVPSAPKPKVDPKAVDVKLPRSPVVTILGHVDHGKTSLLDYIRKANVAGKEHGGITQHIGAYQVDVADGSITFLDTPGHAAFTHMRARGAQVTDIAVLVVAADDGFMPQTIEAMNHAKSAGVPIIIAANKIDKPEANVERVMQQMTQHEMVPEAYGGQVAVVPVSAQTGEGVPDLLERILLEAEIMDLRANPRGPMEGVVIEAKLERGRGPVATLLIEEGTLKLGTIIVVGKTWGKIKAMTDYLGATLKEAGPSTPVEVLGLNEVPMAGDKIEPVASEREARDLVGGRVDAERLKASQGPKRRVTLKDIRRQFDEDDSKTLNLIIKADVQGSVEAVRGLLEKINNEEVEVKILHSGVGAITESDVHLASASHAICVGFNIKPEPNAKVAADRAKVEIRTYNIIYELIEDIEAAIHGMLEPKFEEQHHGTVEIRVAFKLTRQGKVAGSHVTEGKITRNSLVRVKRGNELVFDGKLDSLKNVKQDVREMIAGQDCGIKFDGWEDFKEGDVIEAFELVQVN
jgi:translation initiation factor IF-2